ncbi:MAG TPA: hemolysin family protein [Thermomicrobiales bacterium]|jgi:CBS domain containing-hemolysin-like protein
MSAEVWKTIAGLAMLALIVFLNAYFVATEYGLVASRRSRIEQLATEGHSRARWVTSALNNLNPYISATQIGITIAGLALGYLGEPVVAKLIEPAFAWLPANLPVISAHVIAVIFSFLIVTYVTVLMSELLPKRIAIQNPERMALIVIGPIRVFLVVFRPLIVVLNNSANFLLRRLGLADTGEHGTYTEEELRILVRESEQAGTLERGERELIDRVFSFADKEAQQVMVPRTQVVGIEMQTRIADVAPQVATSTYTRFPVYEENLDTIYGMVHVKDIIAAVGSGRGEEQVRAIMRPVLVVPEAVHIDDLMLEMRRKHTHMAILVDDYGGTAGLVTMEDLIEELVGDIEDEFDSATPQLKRNPDGSITVDGRTPIGDVRGMVALGDVDDGYETIAGYVLDRMGRIPKAGDSVDTEHLHIRVDRMDRLRIAQVTITPTEGAARPASDDAAAD